MLHLLRVFVPREEGDRAFLFFCGVFETAAVNAVLGTFESWKGEGEAGEVFHELILCD